MKARRVVRVGRRKPHIELSRMFKPHWVCYTIDGISTYGLTPIEAFNKFKQLFE